MTEYAQEAFFDENVGDFVRERRMHYLVVNAVSRRVRQLQLGERPLALPSDGNREPIRIALQEFLDDQLEVVPRVHLENDEEQEPMTEID